MGVKDIARRLARSAGYVVHRWPPNRFEAMDAALAFGDVIFVRRGSPLTRDVESE
jgi:hypothetical protein